MEKGYILNIILVKHIRQNNIDEIIEDLFNIEKTLEKKIRLLLLLKIFRMILLMELLKVSGKMKEYLLRLEESKLYSLIFLNMNMFLDMKFSNEDQIEEFKKRYNITNDTMIPEISRFDPVALALLMRPKQICKITPFK